MVCSLTVTSHGRVTPFRTAARKRRGSERVCGHKMLNRDTQTSTDGVRVNGDSQLCLHVQLQSWVLPLGVFVVRALGLVPVRRRLVGAVLRDADVVGLVVGEDGQVGAQLAQMQLGDLLVELLGEQVHLVGVLHLLLVLAGLVVRLAQLELGEGLVGERVGHDERRVAGGAAEVEQAALGEDDDAVAVGEDVLVALRLDVLR